MNRWSLIVRRVGRVLPLALLGLATTGCTFQFLVATASVIAGGSATYVVEIFNDGVNPPEPLRVYTLAHVPADWQLLETTFTATTSPGSGTGTEIADPGFACDQGTPLPAPGAGRQRVVVDWGTFDIGNPETGTGTHVFQVAEVPGDYTIDFFLVLEGGGDSVCSTGISTVTRVETPIFADGFESGNTSAWSSTVGGSP